MSHTSRFTMTIAGVVSVAIVMASVPASGATLEEICRLALRESGGTGFVHVRDARSGRVLAHVADADRLGAEAHVQPLSVIKVFVAALWLEHGLGDVPVRCRRPERQMRFDEMLISGCDSAGADMAVVLRRKIGGAG